MVQMVRGVRVKPGRVVLASGNPGKLAEFQQLLADWHCEVLPQSAFAAPEVAETGDSFAANALLKAHGAARHCGLPAIADDSGLAVDALGGAPGIYSARYAEADRVPDIHSARHANDSGLAVDALGGARDGALDIGNSNTVAPSIDDLNNAKLLRELAGLPPERRGARYHCVLVYLRHWQDPNPVICHATWEGRILERPTGSGGFGYDPLFHVTSEGCAAAELTPARKNAISHRGKAMGLLLDALRGEFE